MAEKKQSTATEAAAPSAQSQMQRAFLKKITTTLAGLSTEILEKVAESAGETSYVPVLRVYGRCSNFENGTTQYGPYTKFGGEFEAVNMVERKIYRSKLLILPAIAEQAMQEMVAAGLSSEIPKDAKIITLDSSVTVALDVTVKFYANSNPKGTKFIFGVESKIKAEKQDALSLMGEALGDIPMLSLPSA